MNTELIVESSVTAARRQRQLRQSDAGWSANCGTVFREFVSITSFSAAHGGPVHRTSCPHELQRQRQLPPRLSRQSPFEVHIVGAKMFIVGAKMFRVHKR